MSAPRPAPEEAAAPQTPWPATRQEAAQMVWGEGFIGPHDEATILHLVNILRLTPEMSILDLGAGLGGPSRVLAERLGLWITGREISGELASAGMELAHKAGLAKKAPVEHIDPLAPDLPAKKYEVVVAFDTFYRVEDKAALFREVEMWARRTEALQSGALAVYRIYCDRK